MIKYLIPFAGLLVILVAFSYVSAEEAEKSDLEAQDFLFRPVYIRYGYHPHNSYGWKGKGGVQQGGHGWGHQPYGYGWGSYHHGGGGGGKKSQKQKKKAQKKKRKQKKKQQKKGGKGGGGGWQQQGWGGGGGGGYGGGYGGYGGYEE